MNLKHSANAAIRRGFLFCLLLIVPVSTSIPAQFSLVTVVVAPPVAQIVTLRAGVDVDGLVNEFNLKPSHVYRHALKGFAAPLDSATIERLKQDGRILAVEADGEIVPCA